jgi:hypothetical protein
MAWSRPPAVIFLVMEFGNPVPIPRAFNFGNSPADVRSHDITRDGKQFLGLAIAGGLSQPDAARPPQIQVVLNWFEELKQRVPVK